jgi:hypothetical protein
MICEYIANNITSYQAETPDGCKQTKVARPTDRLAGPPLRRNEAPRAWTHHKGRAAGLNQITSEEVSGSFRDLYGNSEVLKEGFRMGDESLESKKLEEIQLDGSMYPIHRRTADVFAKAGLAEFDADPPFRARMANGIIESCTDAASDKDGGRQDLPHQIQRLRNC